jgi:hypothetical protein
MSKHQHQRILTSDTAVITTSTSQTVSSAVDLGGTTFVGIYTPATLTSTSISFQASHDNITFSPVENGSGSAISITVSGSEYVPLNPADFAGVQFIKVIAGSNEAADRTFTLALRPL